MERQVYALRTGIGKSFPATKNPLEKINTQPHLWTRLIGFDKDLEEQVIGSVDGNPESASIPKSFRLQISRTLLSRIQYIQSLMHNSNRLCQSL